MLAEGFLIPLIFPAIIIYLSAGPDLTKAQELCPARPLRARILIENRDRKLFYVDAAIGNDSWSGTLFIPDKAGHDGPFKTLQGAISGIRKQEISGPKTLYVRRGEYYVTNRIRLDKEDSNLSIIGYPGDKRPVISGGYKIPGNKFVRLNKKLYAAHFDGKCSKHAYLGKKRLVRARKPNLNKWTGNNFAGEGPYLTIKNLLRSTPKCDIQGIGGFKQEACPDINKRGFVFNDGDINPHWLNIKSGQIIIFEAWNAKRVKIRKVFSNNRLVFKNALQFPIGMHPKSSGWRYIVENIFEELDAIGEFWCDEKNQDFYVIPPHSTTLKFEDIYMGSTETFFLVRNAQNIRFTDLEFRCSNDPEFARFHSRPALLDFENSRNITVDRCEFSNIGYTAIYFVSCLDVKILENKFYDIGYIAVSADYRNDPTNPMATRDVLIKKNTFEGCGVVAMLQPCCVHVRGVANINVTDNKISRTSYAGIRVGWQKTFTSEFIPKGKYIFHIERNNIHDYGMGILSDFAGVYLSSNAACGARYADLTKCHIHAYVGYNTIHHSLAYRYGGMGVYGDTAVASITVEKNWLYDLNHAAINFHCGQNNFALNNMIYHIGQSRVFGTCNAVVGSGVMPRQILTFKRNVIYVANTQAHMFRRFDVWKNDVPTVNNNIYYFKPFNQETFEQFFPKYRSWEAWRNDTKNDLNSKISDPHFASIKRDDYRLRKISVAFSLGIESFDLRRTRLKSGIC